ncbi:MAG: hypothetical protein IKI78_02470 [Clostridia bacterium]|nr:hypothetical protein [Clostridia bacterium]
MKKIIAIIITAVLVAGLAACGLSKQPEETAPKAFKAGVWAVIEDGKETGKTYTFTDSMKECAYDNGLTGIGFDYDIQGEDYVFHMGSADDNTIANVIFTDDENCTVAWADRGVTETLKYIGEVESVEEGAEVPDVERRMIINSEPYVITVKDGFDNAGVTELICDATETYSFKSSDENTAWKVFVLDKKFEDGARFLPQAEKAALEGDGTLEIAEGKYIYILCSESSLTADEPSDATLSINYAQEESATQEAPAAEGRRLIINSEDFVVTAKDGFDNAGVTELICDADATYSFKASDENTTWKVFVLDERFTDGARYLSQAEEADLEGDGTLEIDEGEYIYILCSESMFSADSASDAYLTIGYAE